MMEELWLVVLKGKEVIQSGHRAQPGSATLPNSLVCRAVSTACPRLLLHSSHNNLLHHPSFSGCHGSQSHAWMSTSVEARAVPTQPFLSEVFPAALSAAGLVFLKGLGAALSVEVLEAPGSQLQGISHCLQAHANSNNK